MQRVWRGEMVVEGLPPIGPEPVQPGGPPLLTAAMGPKSLARSAVWAAGLAGFDLGPDPVGVDATFRRAEDGVDGRGPGGSAVALDQLVVRARRRRCRTGSSPTRSTTSRTSATAPRRRWRRCAGSRTPVRCVRHLAALRETGCQEVVLVPTTTDIAEIDRLLAAIG